MRRWRLRNPLSVQVKRCPGSNGFFDNNDSACYDEAMALLQTYSEMKPDTVTMHKVVVLFMTL